MAYATTVTIGAGRKVSVNYNSQEVSVTVGYQLERDDTDLLEFVQEKAAEVEQAHRTAWRRLKQHRSEEKTDVQQVDVPQVDVDQKPPHRSSENGALSASHDVSLSPDDNFVSPKSGAAHNGFKRQHAEEAPLETREELSTRPQQQAIQALANRLSLTTEDLETLLATRFGLSTLEELTKRQAGMILEELQRKARQRQSLSSHIQSNNNQKSE